MDKGSGTSTHNHAELSEAIQTSEVSGGLCSACRHLFKSIDPSWPVSQHFTSRVNPREGEETRSYNQVKQSAERGCAICTMVLFGWGYWRDRMDNLPEVCFGLENVESDGASRIRLSATVLLQPGDPSMGYPGLELAIAQVMVEPAGLEVDRYDLMSSWIEECLRSHSDCQEDISQEWLPSRLVDVSDLTNPKLVITETISPNERTSGYMTLSHRWSDRVMCLRTDTIDQFQRALPLSSISKTFLDAFAITHRMGARYIWIDSLCILQDSEEDWEIESPQMGRIYRHCLCNLSATIADRGDGMDFDKAPDPWKISSAFEFRMGGQDGGSSETQGRFRAVTAIYDRIGEAVDSSPLNLRGWVFQERLLSPRTIHFAPGEFFWECRSAWSSEFKRSFISELDNPEELSSLQAKWSFSGPEKHAEDWHRLTKDYALRHLTRGSDRLMALAGIAKAVADHWQETGNNSGTTSTVGYLAGIWREELPEGLFWMLELQDGTSCTRTKHFTAPSWSWTSLDFEAASLYTAKDYELDADEPKPPVALVRVLGADIVPQDGFDEFGPIVGGQIILSGRVYPVNLAKLPDLGPNTRVQEWFGSPCGGCKSLPFQFLLDENPNNRPDNLEVVADFFLPLLAKKDDGHGCVKCLLLKQNGHVERVKGGGKAKGYTRVGILCVSLHEWWDTVSEFEKEKGKQVEGWSEKYWPTRWTSGMISEADDIWGGVVAMGRAALASSKPDEVTDFSEVITLY